MSEAKRVVTLENGEVVDFGVRANLITSFDTTSNEVTFKIFSGEVIVWDTTVIKDLAIESFSEFAKTVVLYGLLAKIKTNLASVKLYDEVDGEQVHSLANSIKDQIETINSGKFSIRATGTPVVGSLSLDQKAFATAVFKHAKFAESVSIEPEVAVTWADLENETVIASIISLWDTYTVSNKNVIRKQPYFALEKANLQLA